MHFERRNHWSVELGKEIFFNVYGHAGKPIIVFPSSGGSQNEYGDFDMIEVCQDFINRGFVRFSHQILMIMSLGLIRGKLVMIKHSLTKLMTVIL